MSDSSRDDRTRDPRTLARETLRAAGEGPEPDMSRLLAAVPAMLSESRRRRQMQERDTPLAAMVPFASRVIPRLAAATAVLALLATATLVFDLGSPSGDRTDLDSVLLGGAETGGVEELLLGRSASLGDENG